MKSQMNFIAILIISKNNYVTKVLYKSQAQLTRSGLVGLDYLVLTIASYSAD